MTIKIVSMFAALFVVLLVTQAVSSEEVEYGRPDVLYILNPDTIPKILTESDSQLTRGDRSNLVCTAAMCQRVCWALNYRYGRCNANRVCVLELLNKPNVDE